MHLRLDPVSFATTLSPVKTPLPTGAREDEYGSPPSLANAQLNQTWQGQRLCRAKNRNGARNGVITYSCLLLQATSEINAEKMVSMTGTVMTTAAALLPVEFLKMTMNGARLESLRTLSRSPAQKMTVTHKIKTMTELTTKDVIIDTGIVFEASEAFSAVKIISILWVVSSR